MSWWDYIVFGVSSFWQSWQSAHPFLTHSEVVPDSKPLVSSDGSVIETEGIPLKLKELLWNFNRLSLKRDHAFCQICERSLIESHKGMSPKKDHEVSHLSSFISDILGDLDTRQNIAVKHVVDVGAGQVSVHTTCTKRIILTSHKLGLPFTSTDRCT